MIIWKESPLKMSLDIECLKKYIKQKKSKSDKVFNRTVLVFQMF